MNPVDFVYTHCQKSALNAGLSDIDAKEVADKCLEAYKRSTMRPIDIFLLADSLAKIKAKALKIKKVK